MLRGCTVLLLLLCAGEAASRALRLPVPGAVVGMALALALMIWQPRLAGVVEAAADLLIRHLSLLFVPAGVGVVAIAASLSGEWLAIIATLLVSATLAILVTAACTAATARWLARRAERLAPADIEAAHAARARLAPGTPSDAAQVRPPPACTRPGASTDSSAVAVAPTRADDLGCGDGPIDGLDGPAIDPRRSDGRASPHERRDGSANRERQP